MLKNISGVHMMRCTVNNVGSYDLPLASVDPKVCGGYTECDPSPGVKCGSELYCCCNSHAVWTFVDVNGFWHVFTCLSTPCS